MKELAVLELNGNKFDPEDDCVGELRKALELHGNEDALDDCEYHASADFEPH
jgi:Ran GTPase-activating protein 1